MPNIIKFPLYGSGPTLIEPKYTFVNVSDLFKLDVAIISKGDGEFDYGFDFIYKKSGNNTNNNYIASRLMYKDVEEGSGETNMSVELDRLNALIKRSSSAPNSQPLFELLPTVKSIMPNKAYIHHVDSQIGYIWTPPA